MKDFAKSIVCNVKAEVAKIGNYDPKDYENDPRHKWTIKSIENEIQKYKQRIELNRVRMTQLRNMENSGNYPSSSRELKEEQKDYEANQMKVKQLVSMLRRATGNELPEDMFGNKAFQEKTLQYAYEKAKSKGLSGKALEDETLRIATHAAPYASSVHSDSLRREVQEFLLKVGNSKVGNGITKFGLGSYVIADGYKAVVLGETVERGPNGIPFGWVTIRWIEGPWKGQNDQQYDYDLKRA